MNLRLAAVTAVVVLLLGSPRLVICERLFPDVITTKSGEKIEGRIKTESDQSVTISVETANGTSERVIQKSDIDHTLRGSYAPTPTAKPEKLEHLNAPSPDRKWDYVADNPPKILNANTSRIALEFPANGAYYSAPIWAPDSRRFAVNYGQGRVHNSLIYQLSGEEWKELTRLGDDDQTLAAPNKNITAQLKAKGLPENVYLRLIRQSVQLHRWLDSTTAIVYADLAERPESEDLLLVANFALTVRFNPVGNWKITKSRLLSEKEMKTFEH